MKAIGTYQNGNYTVTMYEDGTKVRENELDNLTPAFAENIDVCLTKRCKQMCPFCYEGCTKFGKHSDIMRQNWIHTLHPFTEIALNVNDMDHPSLYALLAYLASRRVIANITVNQKQFLENMDTIREYSDRGFVHWIGISVIDFSDEEMIDKALSFKNVVFHTINGLFSERAYNAIRGKGAKVLVLGYKMVRRGVDFAMDNNIIPANMNWLKMNIRDIVLDKEGLDTVSFDNLAIEQLSLKDSIGDLVNWDEFYMGDDGKYTFYIDAVNGTFAKNSIISEKENFPIEDKSVDEMFNFIREKYK